MPLPIPLHGLQGPNVHAGTGFLVGNGADVWLVTCVHIITGLKETLPSRYLFQGAQLRVVGTCTAVHLFDGAIQRFSVVVNQMNGFLVDVMAIKLTPLEAATLLHYGTYNLSTIVAPNQGEPVTAIGFPGMGEFLVNAMTMEGRIEEIVGISIKLTVPSAPGYSGSALSGETGLIGIVHADVGENPNFQNALAISFEEIGPQIFV